jgi:hypothetical protein
MGLNLINCPLTKILYSFLSESRIFNITERFRIVNLYYVSNTCKNMYDVYWPVRLVRVLAPDNRITRISCCSWAPKLIFGLEQSDNPNRLMCFNALMCVYTIFYSWDQLTVPKFVFRSVPQLKKSLTTFSNIIRLSVYRQSSKS